jgi:putative flippase GtrA
MRALKFGTVGIANTALDWSLFGLLTLVARVPAVGANLISYSAGIALSFYLNRAWTFRDRGERRHWRQLLTFLGGSLAGLALSTAVVALLMNAWGPLLAKSASVCVTFAWNYLFSDRVVFRR